MKDIVPGWAPVDPEQVRDHARRPLGEIVREVFRVYGAHLEPILVMAAVIEGSLALISLPYLVLTIRAFLAEVGAMGEFLRAPTSGGSYRAVAEAFDPFRDPVVGVYGGAVSLAPLASSLLLAGAIGAYLMTSDPTKRTAANGLRAVAHRWAPLLLPVIGLAAIVAVFTIWSFGWSAAAIDRPPLETDLGDLWVSALLAIVAPIAIGLVLYLAVRWVVFAPALVVERIGLRTALARSAALTRRRRVHVTICLVVLGVVWSFLGWLVFAPAFLVAGVIESGGGGPFLAIPLALYVIGRIVFAPLLPILTVILYRDFQTAGPASEPPGLDPRSAPPGWGSRS